MRFLFAIVLLIGLNVHAEESAIVDAATKVEATTITQEAMAAATPVPGAAQVVANEANQPIAATPATAEAKPDNRKESEISLNLENTKKAADNDHPLARFLAGIFVFGILAAGGYIYIRRNGKIGANKSQAQIKVISQHYLGPKKSLAIVRVAGESILIGITDHNITMMKSLSLLDEDVPEETPQNFSSALGKFSIKEKEFKAEKKAKDNLEPDEEFAIKGIKDVVSKRLKNMRTLE